MAIVINPQNELPEFNPSPAIEQLRLSNNACCFVIDDVLLNPERVVRYAFDHQQNFRNVDFNAYPGTYLLSREIDVRVNQFFMSHIRHLFDARRTLHMHCRLSMVTIPPNELFPYQRMCHRDISALESHHSIQAAVLYLFNNTVLGGTSFYEAARPAGEMSSLFQDATMLPSAIFAQKYPEFSGYMHGSNRYFQCVGTVPAKWNRMIFYDGYLLHSGDILAPEKLNNDPLTGRLTLNAFFTSRRHLARA